MKNAVKLIVEENKIIMLNILMEKIEPTYQLRIYLKTFQLEKVLSNKNAENYYIRDIIKSIAISHPKLILIMEDKNKNLYSSTKVKQIFIKIEFKF